MTGEKHIARHEELHRCLDELMADMIRHTEAMPSTTTVMNLMRWSYEQTKNPTEGGVEGSESGG